MEHSLSGERRGLPGLPVLLLGGFVTVFDLFVVNVAAPVIQRQFAADFAGVGLIVAGYELAFGVLLIAGGRLGDRFGRRRLFSLGMLGFTLSSLLCGLAGSLGLLIAARILQGATAALLFPQIYALMRVLYAPQQRRRAFAWLGMTLGLAAIFGQILGGFIIEANLFGSGWRMIFLINLPIGALALWAVRRLPESRVAQAQRLDGVGLWLAATGLSLLLLPLLEGPARGWPWWIAPMLALAMLTLWGFLRWERRLAQRGDNAVLDPALFRQAGFAPGMAVVLAIYATASSFFLCFALLLQAGAGLTPFQAGSLFAPASAAFMLASMLAPRLAQRWGNGVLSVGVAVALEDGLITPVLRNADTMTLGEMNRQVRELAGKARDKKLKPDEYQGGTITVSNLGMFDIEHFYAIVNPPQASIVSVGKVREEPVVENGQIVVGHRMRIGYSGDHRIVDGAVGAQFLQAVKKALENPMRMLVG